MWITFTQRGFIKVIGKGVDLLQTKMIRKGKTELRTAEKLVRLVHDESNLSFAIILPVNRKEFTYSAEEVELALGNYLIAKEVAIIDYFSHNY